MSSVIKVAACGSCHWGVPEGSTHCGRCGVEIPAFSELVLESNHGSPLYYLPNVGTPRSSPYSAQSPWATPLQFPPDNGTAEPADAEQAGAGADELHGFDGSVRWPLLAALSDCGCGV